MLGEGRRLFKAGIAKDVERFKYPGDLGSVHLFKSFERFRIERRLRTSHEAKVPSVLVLNHSKSLNGSGLENEDEGNAYCD